MKKLLLLILLGTGFFTLKSQNYVPFPANTAHWNCLYWWNGSPTTQFYTNYTYTMEGDTIIVGKHFKKMYYKNADDLVNPRIYIGGLREDSLKRIFFYPYNVNIPTPSLHHFPNNTSEHLLYTFNNLNIGDTLPINTLHTKIWITGIDSVLIGSNYRKRYEVHNTHMLFPPEYWIEGIGSTKEFLSPFTDEFECNFFTLCYNNLNNYFINAPGGVDSCHYTHSSVISGIDSYDLLSDKMKLYPSPASKNLTVELEDTNNDFRLSIFNAYGELFFQKTILQLNTNIDISTLSKGLYFVRLSNSNGSVVKKFVKE